MAKPADWDTERRPWLQEPKYRRKTEDRGKTGQKNTTDKQRTEERNGTDGQYKLQDNDWKRKRRRVPSPRKSLPI